MSALGTVSVPSTSLASSFELEQILFVPLAFPVDGLALMIKAKEVTLSQLTNDKHNTNYAIAFKFSHGI